MAAYWGSITFDGHPVVPIPVDCNGRPGNVFKSASIVTDFILSSLKDIRNGKQTEALNLFKFVASHADRRKNELILQKCQFKANKVPCEYCQVHPVKAQQVLNNSTRWMYEPTPSPNLEGHYMTFLEMLNSIDRTHFVSPNEPCQASLLEIVLSVQHGNFLPLRKQSDIFQSYIQIMKRLTSQDQHRQRFLRANKKVVV